MGRSKRLFERVWVSPSGPSGHLPMNGEEQSSAPPAAMNWEEQAAAGSTLTATCVGQV